MMGKPPFAIKLCFLLLAACFILPGSARAESGGWKWRFDLVSPDQKKPFYMPTALFIEADSKRFYVVESGGGSLHSFQYDGKYLNTFKPGDSLKQPFAMAREIKSGMLWVVEKGKNSLTKIDLKAKKLSPETLKFKGETVYPDRLILLDDKLYVLNKLTGDVIAYNQDLAPLEVYKSSGEGFVDFIINNSELWALDSRMKTISRFNSEGKLKGQLVLGDKVSFPVAIEIGPSGFIYVLDKHQGSIVVFDTSGDFKYSFLQKGHVKNRLYYPENIVFDPLGRLCVVDTGNGRIGIFSR
jgi:DNA-binding beta-propeller fold protein YncE